MIVSGYSHGAFSEATWNEAQKRHKKKRHLCFDACGSLPFNLIYCVLNHLFYGSSIIAKSRNTCVSTLHGKVFVRTCQHKCACAVSA